MHDAFAGATAFTCLGGDLGQWDVSSVTNMYEMFMDAVHFNKNIGAWNVSSVVDMGSMFEGAIMFNQDLNGWDVSNSVEISRMFYGATAFSQHFCWNLQYGTDSHDTVGGTNGATVTGGPQFSVLSDGSCQCPYSFEFIPGYGQYGVCLFTPMDRDVLITAVDMNCATPNVATTTYGDISTWNTGLVTDMSSLFGANRGFQCSSIFNANIEGWDTSKVTHMHRIFSDCIAFNRDIGGWDTSSVTNMAQMFW